MNRMTDRCKNITLLQTAFAGDNKENKTALRFPSFGGGEIVRLRGDVTDTISSAIIGGEVGGWGVINMRS